MKYSQTEQGGVNKSAYKRRGERESSIEEARINVCSASSSSTRANHGRSTLLDESPLSGSKGWKAQKASKWGKENVA
jgi:hypothetical protein